MNQPPKLGLFCKTFKPDLPWLYFALGSFAQNWKEWGPGSSAVIVAEPDCQPEIARWPSDILAGIRVVYVQPWPCGYCHAMATKLCADLYLPGCDLILMFDSDMMLTRPAGLADLVGPDGHPTIVYDVWHSDYDRESRNVARKVWGPAVQRSMGVELDRDWMVDPVWVYWRSTFAGARSMIESHCRMPFWQAVYCWVGYDWTRFTEHPVKLCDMEALGVYAFNNEQFKYGFEQRSVGKDRPIKQSWSHSIDGPTKKF